MKKFILASTIILSFFISFQSHSETVNNSRACDSTYIDTIVSCFPYFWDVTDTTYFFTGIYSDTFQTAQGCDSIRVLNATIYTSYISTTTSFICQGDEFIWNNRLLFQSGTYFDTLQTINGCDSVLRLNLFVTPVDTSISRVGNSLQANLTPAASYRWFDCDGDVLIPGATGRTFTPSRSGIYKVQVNDFGCIDFSGCYTFILTDLSEKLLSEINVFPNPALDRLFINIPEEIDIQRARLLSMTGSVLININASLLNNPVNISSVPEGVYYLNLEGENFRKNIRLVIN